MADLTRAEWERYQRHLALPVITPAHQQHLKSAHILIVGAGGLGAPMLPYLAGAGIGHITIIDYDTVSLGNLHRQTIFTTADIGQNKADLAAAYVQALNPEIEAVAIIEKLTEQNAAKICQGFTLLLDGSDNFATKILLNTISIGTKTPLISASVNQMEGQIGIFAGYAKDRPCYRCLFDELPDDARNCNEAGVLNTAAGLTGMHQAHLALSLLLSLGAIDAGTVIACDYAGMRMQHLRLQKDPDCSYCSHATEEWRKPAPMTQEIELLHPDKLKKHDHIIIDVRTAQEVMADPIPGALHMPLHEIPARFSELPQDKLLAFACAANIRSRQAAEFMQHQGYAHVCVMDRLA